MLPKFAEKNAIMPLSQNHTAIAKLLIEKGAKLDEKSYVSKDGVSDKNSLAFSSDNDVYDAFLILKLKWGQKQAILNWKFHLISTVLVIKTQKKMSENGEIYTAGKNFTLLPAVTALTISNSECQQCKLVSTVSTV